MKAVGRFFYAGLFALSLFLGVMAGYFLVLAPLLIWDDYQNGSDEYITLVDALIIFFIIVALVGGLMAFGGFCGALCLAPKSQSIQFGYLSAALGFLATLMYAGTVYSVEVLFMDRVSHWALFAVAIGVGTAIAGRLLGSWLGFVKPFAVDPDSCGHCGYDIRHLQVSRGECPECGAAFVWPNSVTKKRK